MQKYFESFDSVLRHFVSMGVDETGYIALFGIGIETIDIERQKQIAKGLLCARYQHQASKAFFLFYAAVNSANEANKAGSMRH